MKALPRAQELQACCSSRLAAPNAALPSCLLARGVSPGVDGTGARYDPLDNSPAVIAINTMYRRNPIKQTPMARPVPS